MNPHNPLVSIIIPTYNRGNFLYETVRSVLEQTYLNLELIIVDNHSTDNTDRIIKEFNESRIKYFKNHNYGIISVNRNFGIRCAQGDYVYFCDSDDLWEKDKLSTQLKFMESPKDVALCFSNGKIITENGDLRGDYFQKSPPERITYRTLLTHNYVSTLSVAVRRSALMEVGLFDEAKEIVGIEDFELWIRIAKKYSIRYIPEKLFRYRIHKGNEMGIDSYRWARKCMILAKYMRSGGTLNFREFMVMYGYNAIKSLCYYKGIKR
jgi:glycosyltransferase involved in cell wall biosynthesis